MLSPHTTVGPLVIQTYTLLLSIGIVSGMAVIVLGYRLRYVVEAGTLVDLGIALLIGGVVGARVLHVILHWRYFQHNTAEILQIRAGGLNWHGAVVGVLLVAIPTTRLLQLKLVLLLDLLGVVLPLLAFLAWWGCGAATCSYGAEVAHMSDYSAWLTWEAPGEFGLVAPRYATQPLGMFFSGALFVLAILLTRLFWFEERRFWLTLAAFSLVMFALDGLRGDYAPRIAGLRAHQWLDLIFGVFGLLFFSIRKKVAVVVAKQP